MREWKFILLIGVLCGCESVVDLDLPGDYQSKLVIESVFSPDSLWKVHVGKSVLIGVNLPANELIVPNAEIIIFDEDRFRDTLHHINDGVYRSMRDHRPVSGTRYRMQVSAPGFTEAEASSWAPPLQSEFLEIKSIPYEDPYSEERYSIRFRLADRPGKNYYSITLDQVMPYCEPVDGGMSIRDGAGYWTDYWFLLFQSTWPSFYVYPEAVDDPLYPDFDNTFIGGAYFSDRLFEATTVEFEMTFESRSFESIGSYFMVTITALSEDLFAYQRSIGHYDLYVNEPNLTRNTPVTVYTNFRNGLGLFAGYTVESHRFDANGNEWEEDVVGVGVGEIGPCQE